MTSCLNDIDPLVLEWTIKEFLWGHVTNYGLDLDGTISYDPNHWTDPVCKLELLIKLTGERRTLFCENPDVDILSPGDEKIILDNWKDDIKEWMHPQTIYDSW